MSFVHLHSHSEYSMLDGASRIKEMFGRAKDLGMPAVALTDHGVMYGAIPFYMEGKAAGVKPLVGMEGYVAPNARFDKAAVGEDSNYHLTLIAASSVGYHNLIKLSSLGFLEGYGGRPSRPRLDKDILDLHSEGVIALSGCLSGELARNLVSGKLEQSERVARQYKEMFGDRYFLEIQNQGLKEQPPLNKALHQLGKKLGIPLVATNDSHYTCKEDAEAHDILLCIQTGKELADTNRMKFDTDQFYLKSRDEMAAMFPEYPDAIENTIGVAEMCDLEIELGKNLMPDFEVPPGETLQSHLTHLAEEGIRRRYDAVTDEIDHRCRVELKVIEEMGFSGYFLIVADFVQWAKRNKIRVGPGRGSVGSSVVAYALGITDLDPIRWKIGFERFLNPARKTMPDIDIDFDERRRNEVIKYVSEKYGEDHVAQIITFSTIKAKAALRDAARVLGHPYAVGDKLAKMYPPNILGKEAPFAACFDKGYEWPENAGNNQAFSNANELRGAYEGDEVSRQVIDTARKLEGLRRQHSVHAAGVVIGKEPLTNYIPVQKTGGEVVTQYEMKAIDAIGLLKMDFLGLRNLSVIGDALEQITRNRETTVDIDNIPLDDAKTFGVLQQARTAGIFQMESPGMTRLLRQLRPDRFEEISALIALYRPGPMDEIPRYVKGKHDSSAVTYFHPLLAPVLEDTYGVIVYQEQVMLMLQKVAGFTPSESDFVREAIAKKKSAELVKWKERFHEGCAASGLTAKESEELWDLIKPFAGYSFNRAHANGYGLITYQTAWLKTNYPVEYMAALLTSAKDRTDKMPVYLAECRAMGIRVLPPNVNESDMDFTARGDEVLFGLSAVRNVGEQVADRVIKARKKLGEYTGFNDFCRKVDPSCLNKKVIESLGKAGAFDSLSVDRSALLAPSANGDGGLSLSEQAGRLVETVISERRSEDAGQFSLFAGGDNGQPKIEIKDSFQSALDGIEIAKALLLSSEKEMLGFYVSDHPLAAVESALRYQAEAEIPELYESPDGTVKTVGGILTRMVKKLTKKGDFWYQGYLEDMKGDIEVIVWPQTAQETGPALLANDQIVIIKGRVEVRDDSYKLVAQKVKAPDLSQGSTPLRLRMPAHVCTPDRVEELKMILSSHPGPSPVLLYLLNRKKQETVLKLGTGFSVELRNGLFAEIKAAFGAGALLDAM